MTSRTIHPRLKDATIIGCLDILTSVDINHKGMPISSVVSRVLDGFVTSQRRVGAIPSYTDEELKTRIAEVFQQTPIVDPEAAPLSASDFDEEDEEKPIQSIGAAVEEAIKEKSTGRISTEFDLQENPTEPKRIRVTKEQVLAIPNIRSWDSITDEAPLDTLVDAANQANDDAMRLAIRAVYSSIPSTAWGTAVTSDAVNKLYKDIVEDV